MTDDISARIAKIRAKINETCLRLKRDPDEVNLMAVTKMQPISAAREAFNNGIHIFGENRVQEGTEKFSGFRDLGSNIQIHLIGNLQRNKAKKAVNFFDCIQSVDRESLLTELGQLTLEREKPLMIYLEYHTGEESKAGFPDLESLFKAAEIAMAMPGLKPVGLMTMAPFTADKEVIRASFCSCRLASQELCRRFGIESWSGLSMGMSGDFEIALEEGSTLIRIGTAIFGERNSQ